MKKENIKITFMGTPRFAQMILEKIIAAGYEVTAVFTQPDKKIGRKQKIAFSPVKDLAVRNKIEIFQPESLKDNSVAGEIKKINPDLIIVAAYGKILPKTILEVPKYGCINVHASLLPKFRGASPVQSAILEGEKETGVTLILMNEKMDEGDILIQKKIATEEDDTAQSLSGKLAILGAEMAIGFVPDWISGKIKPRKQNEKQATYCHIIKKDNGKIDWNESAEKIYSQWKAYQPWPGIFTFFREGERRKQLKLIEIEEAPIAGIGEKTGKVVEYKKRIAVKAGKGLVVLKKVQLEGKRAVDALSFSRGKKNFIGSYLE